MALKLNEDSQQFADQGSNCVWGGGGGRFKNQKLFMGAGNIQV